MKPMFVWLCAIICSSDGVHMCGVGVGYVSLHVVIHIVYAYCGVYYVMHDGCGVVCVCVVGVRLLCC